MWSICNLPFLPFPSLAQHSGAHLKVLSADRDTNSRKMRGLGRGSLCHDEEGERTIKMVEAMNIRVVYFIGIYRTPLFLAALGGSVCLTFRHERIMTQLFISILRNLHPFRCYKKTISDHKQHTCQTAAPTESVTLSITTFIAIRNLDVYVWISLLRPTNRAP